MSSNETRHSNGVFRIGLGITKSDADLAGSRLPACNQVLRCYKVYRREGLSSNRTQRNTVIQRQWPMHNSYGSRETERIASIEAGNESARDKTEDTPYSEATIR